MPTGDYAPDGSVLDKLVFLVFAMAELFVNIANAMRIVGDGGELRNRPRSFGRLRFEARAYGKVRIQAKRAEDLPIFSVGCEVKDVGVATLCHTQIDRISSE